MYTVFKTKRCYIQVPESNLHNLNNQQSHINEPNTLERFNTQVQNQNCHLGNKNDMIVSSCFLDNYFILFLFRSGRILIVKSSSLTNPKKKKSQIVRSQIFIDVNIINLLQKQSQNTKKFSQKNTFQSQKPFLQNYSKNINSNSSSIIFTECKRISINESVIITQHSQRVFRVKIYWQNLENLQDISKATTIQVSQLPGTMIGHLLQINRSEINSMTILTQLTQFNNSSHDIIHKESKSLLQQQTERTGSFYIKNEVFQDKMVYITFYTKIPQTLRQNYINTLTETQETKEQKSLNRFPQFILTKFQFAIPINQVSSNYVFQVSDKFNNQIVIYKQYEDDGIEREVKFYRFDFQSIQGENIVKMWLQKHKIQRSYSNEPKKIPIVIQNQSFPPKPTIIQLPNQFTSCIQIEQIIRLNNQNTHKNQLIYMIISNNQTVVENQNNPGLRDPQFERINANEQIFDLHNNENLLQPLNILHPQQMRNRNCWVHRCRLNFHENTQSFSSFFQRQSIIPQNHKHQLRLLADVCPKPCTQISRWTTLLKQNRPSKLKKWLNCREGLLLPQKLLLFSR